MNPEAYFKFRKVIEQDGNTVHGVTFAGSELQKGAVEAFRAMMEKRLANKPEIAEFLTPSFGVGRRRLTPGPGYLEALIEDNVEFVTAKIRSIMPKGVELENGRIVELDALVCATDFNAVGPPPFAVTGRNGASLVERYKPYPETYLSMAIDGFPNYFMMLGPNAGVCSGSLTMILEMEGDYVTKCIRKLQKEDYVTMTPKRERVKDFSQYIDEYFKKTVHLSFLPMYLCI
jgi:cation diffusion facilitator CzcD-associated flavoprotein CzcO